MTEEQEEIAELSDDILEMLFQAIDVMSQSIIPPRLQDKADILLKAFNKYREDD